MQLKNLLIGGSIGLFFFAVYVASGSITHAATKSVSILNNGYTPSILSAVEGDTVIWTNNDAIGHRLDILNATDSSFVAGNDLLPKVSTSTAGRTLSRKFNEPGDFVFRLDQQATISGILTIFPSFATETPSASPTASPTFSSTPAPTVSATPSATPTATASPTVQPTVSASPSATPTVSPTPTASPTATPTPVVTASPTPTVTATASPTVMPTVAPTATPTITPTVTPSPVATASPTIAPTATPTVSPTASPTVTPSIAPTATPQPTVQPTPEGEVLPAFSVFRRTSCSAVLINNSTQVLTDKLNPIILKRGIWNVLSLQNTPPTVSAQVKLISVRTVNLMFGSNPFFGLDRTVPANFTTTFTDTSVDGLLRDASDAWCKM